MSDSPQIYVPKTLIAITWLLAAASFLVPETSSMANWAATGRLLFIALSVSHAFECLLFLPTLKKSARPLGEEILLVFFFGVVHYAQVRRELEMAAE